LSSQRGFLSRSLGWLIAGIWFLCRAVLIAWATLAIYYSNLPWAGLRMGLAGAFAAFAIWAFWLSRQRRMSVVVIVLFLGVVAWWISIRPSHDRDWRPEVAVMPRATGSIDTGWLRINDHPNAWAANHRPRRKQVREHGSVNRVAVGSDKRRNI
jgi:hypothetical protein